MQEKSRTIKSHGHFLEVLSLLPIIFACCFFLQGCFFSVIAGKPIGTGVGGNEFEIRPGIQVGQQVVKSNGKGYRVGAAYQELSNTLGDSTADGHIMTPLFYDYIGNIHNTYTGAKGFGTHFTLGGSWYFSKLDEVDEYDGWGSLSLAGGLTFRYINDKTDLSLSAKYIYYLDDEILDALDQDGGGFEIGFIYSF